MSILEGIGSPEDIKELSPEALPSLCEEVRQVIIDTVMQNGGHLASSLGTVELIVALLRTFDFLEDRVLFDVGHQAYAYKLLTDRKDLFSGLRVAGGISGYPKRTESPYDAFDVGHSSTALSAALGYAKARDLRQDSHHVVAVVGDGALLNGMAMEALNHARDLDTRLIMVLNDNEMSINRRVGGLANHIAHLSVHPFYKKFKDFVKEHCRHLPKGDELEEVLGKFKSHVKTLFQPSNLFEELGVSYWGPFDGHDVKELETIFHLAMEYDSPLLLHVITKKGKGYVPAEDNPAKYHGVGKPAKTSVPAKRGWSSIASETLVAMAEKDPGLVCMTAAMKEGTKLGVFEKRYPHRFFDVGIAEEHMLTFASGMAAGGLHPVVCIYSTFLQRAMDQLVHDMAMQKLSVLLCVDRAGLVGEDGETHHGLLDMAWCRSVPNVHIAAPRDGVDLEFFFSQGFVHQGPVMVRYPRGSAPESLGRSRKASAAAWGKGEILEEGEGTVLLGIGSTVALALDVQRHCREEGIISPGVCDLRFIKPLDENLLDSLGQKYHTFVVLEEGSLIGGVGQAVAALFHGKDIPCKVVTLGVPDCFVSQGTRKEQWEKCGLTVQRVVEYLRGEEQQGTSGYSFNFQESRGVKEQSPGAYSGGQSLRGRAAS